jgi:hypothetical protein
MQNLHNIFVFANYTRPDVILSCLSSKLTFALLALVIINFSTELSLLSFSDAAAYLSKK